jgi:hypothetical protein
VPPGLAHRLEEKDHAALERAVRKGQVKAVFEEVK